MVGARHAASGKILLQLADPVLTVLAPLVLPVHDLTVIKSDQHIQVGGDRPVHIPRTVDALIVQLVQHHKRIHIPARMKTAVAAGCREHAVAQPAREVNCASVDSRRCGTILISPAP